VEKFISLVGGFLVVTGRIDDKDCIHDKNLGWRKYYSDSRGEHRIKHIYLQLGTV
jgi:hypothetical protein